MGKRGPAPTPTHLLLLRGSRRATERMKRTEPQPRKGKPPTPAWLDPIAKTAYRWLVRQLDGMGLLTLADGKSMERYAALYSRWRQAEKLLREHGQVMLVKLKDGSVVPRKNPAVGIASDLSAQLGRIEASLGLNPSARVNLHMSADGQQRSVPTDGRAARFLSGGA